MRWIGYSLVALSLLAGMIALAGWSFAHWPSREISAPEEELLGRRTVFVLRADQWTRFALPPQTNLVRVSSRLLIPDDATEDTQLPYSISYRLSEQLAADYHLRSRPPLAGESSRRRADSGDQVLSRQRNFYLDTRAREGAILELKLKDSQSSWVAIEVASKVDRSAGESRLLWQRLRGSVRSELARASITPVGLLARDELDRLLQHGWQPLGPEGVAEKDYFAETTYVVPVTEDANETVGLEAQGTMVSPWHFLSVPIPETLLIRVVATAPEPTILRLRGAAGGLLATLDIAPPNATIWAGMVSDGIQIETEHPARVQLFDADADTVLAPDFGAAPHFLLGEDKPVVFQLAAPTLTLRADLRSFASDNFGQTALDAEVEYRWLSFGADPQSDDSWSALSVDAEPTFFDRLHSTNSFDRVNQRARYFLTAPSNAQAIEFRSVTPALVALANRPTDLAWRRFSDSLDDSIPAPAWFAVYPENEADLIEQDRRVLIRSQRRLSEVVADLGDDRFEWRALRAINARVQQQIMMPSELVGADSSAFAPLRPGRNSVRFAAVPQLLYRGRQANPAEVTVRFAGGEINRQVIGRQGVLSLPDSVVQSPWIELDRMAGAQWWINQLEGEHDGLRRRRVYSLDSETLSLWVDKRGEDVELVNLEIYLAQPSSQPSLLSVLKLPAPAEVADDHTITRRRLLLADHSIQQSNAWLLGRYQDVLAAQRGVVVLGRDVPPGRYRLNLSLDQGSQGFVAAYQLQRGLEVMARYSSEALDR